MTKTIPVTLQLPKQTYGVVSELVRIVAPGKTIEEYIQAEFQHHLKTDILSDTEFLGEKLSEHLCKKYDFRRD